MPNMGLDLDIEFKAIPEYDKERRDYLKSLRLERFEEKRQTAFLRLPNYLSLPFL